MWIYVRQFTPPYLWITKLSTWYKYALAETAKYALWAVAMIKTFFEQLFEPILGLKEYASATLL